MLAKARTLSEALPYMRQYSGRTFVIKYGGHAMGDADLGEQFARDIVLLLKQVGIHPIVVHGGGPQIGQMLERRLRIKSEFIDGLRVTDQETVEIVEMVLSGSINKQICYRHQQCRGQGGGPVRQGRQSDHRPQTAPYPARPPPAISEKIMELGFVGEPSEINPEILETFEQSAVIPVIAPIGVGRNGETFNINADTAAGAIAAAIGATRLFLLTDVAGVLNKQKELLTALTLEDCHILMEDGTISGGMIPKLETCIQAVEQGVEAAVILDGRVPHALLLEIFTEHGAGTMIAAA